MQPPLLLSGSGGERYAGQLAARVNPDTLYTQGPGTMRRNRLRELLKEGQPSLGTRIMSPWPTVIEIVGHSGMFDYVEFVAEYAPYDLHTLENIGRTVELFDHMTAMMKVEQEPRTYLAVRGIGSGIQNMLFADPRNVEDVQECVSAVRAERPESGGRHGVGMRRDVGTVLEAGTEAFADALDDAVVAIMIEKQSAVENLDAILSVPGVDMVQFGPADYSMSLGLTGQMSHPKVLEAEQYVIETAHKKGIAARAELNDAQGFEHYLELGVRHFNLGVDIRTLYDWYGKAGAVLRKELNVEPPVKAGSKVQSSYGR